MRRVKAISVPAGSSVATKEFAVNEVGDTETKVSDEKILFSYILTRLLDNREGDVARVRNEPEHEGQRKLRIRPPAGGQRKDAYQGRAPRRRHEELPCSW